MKLKNPNYTFFFVLLLVCFPVFSNSQSLIRKKFGAYIGTTSIGDIDNDGDIDIFATTRTGFQNNLYTYKNINGVYINSYQFSDKVFNFMCFDYYNDNTYDFFGILQNSSKIYKFNYPIYQPEITIGYVPLSFCATDNNSDNKTELFFHSNNSYLLDGQSSQITQLTSFDELLISYCHSNDFNHDGKLDLLMIARPKLCDESVCPPDSNHIYIAYNINSDYQITEINNSINVKSIYVRDYDLDGDNDILFCDDLGIGILENQQGFFLPVYSYSIKNVIYVSWINVMNNNIFDIFFTLADNNSYLLTNNSITSLGLGAKNYILADFDNDGDTDLLTNSGMLGGNRLYGFFFNTLTSLPSIQNHPPDAPRNLLVTYEADTTYFNWNASTDDTTPQNELTYNIYIGSTLGTTDIMSPLADLATGWRKIVGIGNVDANLGWKLRNLPCGTYYWSVQAIDNSYAGGKFAPESIFTIPCGFSFQNTCFGETTIFSLNTKEVQSVLWHFGDSQTSAELSPTHTYEKAGTYTVSVAITYSDNSTETISKEIEIFETPEKPIIKYEESTLR